jgi:ribose transport system permease protein
MPDATPDLGHAQPRPAAERVGRGGLRARLEDRLDGRLGALLRVRELGLLALLVAGAVGMTWLNPYFLTGGNLRAVVVGFAPGAIIAVGMALLLAAGEFDLSVAGVMALAGTVAAWLLVHGVATPAAAAGAVTLGVLLGAGNGLLVTVLRINPLIATLGMMSMTRGLALVMTEGYNISNLPASYTVLGQQGPAGLPWMVWIAAVLVAAADLGLRRTRLLWQLYFLGGNRRAAHLSGIRVNDLRRLAYMLSGGLAALAGVLLAARLSTAIPTAGQGLELEVIAAAVIGGASLSGGEGTVIGAVLGVCFLRLLANALTLLSISVFWQIFVTGLVLLVAVSLDVLMRARRPGAS